MKKSIFSVVLILLSCGLSFAQTMPPSDEIRTVVTALDDLEERDEIERLLFEDAIAPVEYFFSPSLEVGEPASGIRLIRGREVRMLHGTWR